MYKLYIFWFTCLFSLPSIAEDQSIAHLFMQQGIEGTLVMSALHSDRTFIHNDPRANRRYSPASTFKILNTLISLEERAVSGKDDIFKWDGHVYAIQSWNHDQTLESAFKASCVWCFQDLAQRVGAKKYSDYLHDLAYGKLYEPFVVTTFWLDGSLEISAIEQVEFIKKVYQRSLPFTDSSYETLRQIMLIEQAPAFTMRAKTGLSSQSKPKIGWYVGYIETLKDVWFFAVNIDVRDENDLPLRQKITRLALQTKGIIE